MNFIAGLFSSFQHFYSHPLRTFLTTLGMIIGVASLVSMIGIGEGVRQRVIHDMERLGGTGLIIIEAKNTPDTEESLSFGELTLRRSDLKAFKRASSYIERTASVSLIAERFHFERYQSKGICLGITSGYAKIRGWSIESGRFIIQSDIKHSKKVCVLGSEIRNKLFKTANPVGKRMMIGTEEFTIVGLMSERNFEAGRWMNHLVLIPLSTMEARYIKPDHLNQILVKATSTAMVPVLKQQIKRVLERRRRHPQQFNIFSQEEVIRSVAKSTLLLRLAQGVSAAIVLLVGGIGVMNLMLVSVTERTKEIGIRKAVGATDMQILLQFLQEAVIISTVGGIIGVFAGLVVGELSSTFIAINLNDNVQSIVSLKAIGLALASVFIAGVFFGLYPAIRAARLDPSRALSYE